MIENLQRAGEVAVPIYVVSSMLLLGMSLRLSDVVAPLRQPRTVVVALAVNFIAAPLVAFLLSRVIPLEPAHAIGLLLLASAAGSPFIPKLVEVAGGNLAFSVAIMILLIIGSIVFLPAVLPLISPGLSASRLSIAMPLILLMLLPLAIGFVLSARWGRISERVLPFLRGISRFTFLLVLVLLLGLNIQSLIDTLGSFAIGTYILFVMALVLLSYAVGGGDPGARGDFALASGQRNISAALVVAVENFNDPAVVVMVLVGAVVGLFLMLGTARLLRTRMAKMDL
jgi:bile acid:Na+ symporter, BASS family